MAADATPDDPAAMLRAFAALHGLPMLDVDAIEAKAQMHQTPCAVYFDGGEVLPLVAEVRRLRALVEAAVAEERKACADLAERKGDGFDEHPAWQASRVIAWQIRERGKHERAAWRDGKRAIPKTLADPVSQTAGNGQDAAALTTPTSADPSPSGANRHRNAPEGAADGDVEPDGERR
jgi:hypothetical protein